MKRNLTVIEEIAAMEAGKFWELMPDYFAEPDGYEKFAKKVQSKMLIENPRYKIKFLDCISSYISQAHEDHLRTCAYKEGKENCPQNLFYKDAKYFIVNELEKFHLKAV